MRHRDRYVARFRGHRDQVTALQFSHDGKSLASASLDRTAIVWGVGTGAPRAAATRRGRARPGVQPRRRDPLQRRRGPVAPGVGPRAGPAGSWQPRSSRNRRAKPVHKRRPRTGRYVSSWTGPDVRFYNVAAGRWTPCGRRGPQQLRLRVELAWHPGRHVSGKASLRSGIPPPRRVVDEASLDGTYAAVDFSPDDTRIALLDDQGERACWTRRPSPHRGPVSLGTEGGETVVRARRTRAGPHARLRAGLHRSSTRAGSGCSRTSTPARWSTGVGSTSRPAGCELPGRPTRRHHRLNGGELVVLDLDTGEPVGAATKGHATTVGGTRTQ